MEINLFDYQKDILDKTKSFNRVAYYLDMGLGKTFIGSEKIKEFNTEYNLVICQKSKINDWVKHFQTYYPDYNIYEFKDKLSPGICVINYELAWRRKDILNELNRYKFTLMLDESSQIKNETAKKTKFILSLKPINVILLSGTPIAGKYEELWSQCRLLGWKISKETYGNNYLIFKELNIGRRYPIKLVAGYKNVERLKKKLREHGAVFMKSDEVINLPKQVEIKAPIKSTKDYRKFKKDRIVVLKDGTELIGDYTLTKMLYERQLCSQYNENKIESFKDLIESTEERLIVFYNFNDELEKLINIAVDYKRPISVINGTHKDLTNYENHNNSITFIQYQAGAMGLNLQKSNKIIYFSLPLSSELMEQSKKRTHRIGQEKTCFYWYLLTEDSIEEKIFKVLKQRKDYTNRLFEEEEIEKK